MQAQQIPPEVVAVLNALKAQTPSTPEWVRWLDAADKIIKIVGILVGAVWAYYKFVKGRMFRPRLEPSVSGETFRKNDRDYLIASIALKNVGTSKVEIKQAGTALRVFGSPTSATDDAEPSTQASADWKRIVTLSVFEKHGWIESAELIHDQILVAIPADQLALKLELRIVGQGLEWNAKKIVPVIAVEPEKPKSWFASLLDNISPKSPKE